MKLIKFTLFCLYKPRSFQILKMCDSPNFFYTERQSQILKVEGVVGRVYTMTYCNFGLYKEDLIG